GPSSVAVGDFNGDGVKDLAVTNYGDNTVSVLLGNPGGTSFQPALTVGTGSNPQSVVVGDFNGDGILDLAVANYDTGMPAGPPPVWPSPTPYIVSVLLGNSDGTFQLARNFSVGTQPFSVAVGDFNGDGKQDLAVANIADNTVSVLLGNGDGTFVAAQGSPLYAGGGPAFVAVRDFNG